VSAPAPPQNIGAEEAVLSALMLAGAEGRAKSTETVRAVGSLGLAADDFYRSGHGHIYSAALAAAAAGEPTTVLALERELRAAKKLTAAGGKKRLQEIATLAPATSNAAHFAGLVLEAAERREEVEVALALRAAAEDGGLPANAAVRGQLEQLLRPRRSAGALTWLEHASDLLAEPDPGPTPFLVEHLIVDQAILALVGSWEVAKTYALLELSIAIATGQKAFGAYTVAEPGPVMLVLEESGREALHRRLDMLRRGYGLPPETLAELHFSANRRVRLNDPRWQERLLAVGASVQPRAIFFDPFVRVKGAEVNENEQREVAPVLDFLRDLRDEVAAAVGYANHTGYQGTHQRGSSDLEGYWESRLALSKDTNDERMRTVRVEHREAESGHQFHFALAFDSASRSLRLHVVASELERLVEAHMREHPEASKNEVAKDVDGRRADILRVYDVVKERLTMPRLEGM
jgi:AAA domain/DnaB-like helicase N terminal domain